MSSLHKRYASRVTFQDKAEWLNNIIKDYLWPLAKNKLVEEYVRPAFKNAEEGPGMPYGIRYSNYSNQIFVRGHIYKEFYTPYIQ